MELLILSWLIAMYLCVMIAKNNWRSKEWALVMGILFGWIAVIVYACIGKSFEKKLEEANTLRKVRGDGNV